MTTSPAGSRRPGNARRHSLSSVPPAAGDARDLALAALNEELAGLVPLPGPALRRRDAAALILVDFSGSTPRFLVGRRNPGLRFLPDRFVFPGGALDPADLRVTPSHDLRTDVSGKLLRHTPRLSSARLRGLAVAALRELAEETGLLLGERSGTVPSPSWPGFAERSLVPRLDRLHLVARAVTPPGMIRRFDTCFFAADAQDVAGQLPDVVGPHAELVELRWTTIADSHRLDLHVMTRAVVAELAEGLQSGFKHDMPVPFFRVQRGRFIRDCIA